MKIICVILVLSLSGCAVVPVPAYDYGPNVQTDVYIQPAPIQSYAVNPVIVAPNPRPIVIENNYGYPRRNWYNYGRPYYGRPGNYPPPIYGRPGHRPLPPYYGRPVHRPPINRPMPYPRRRY